MKAVNLAAVCALLVAVAVTGRVLGSQEADTMFSATVKRCTSL